jgi:CubicO group peptidase (beta-lactamase class C family)
MNIMSRFTAPFCLFVSLFLFAGCSRDSSLTYSATIAEGRTAVNEIMAETGATSISVALVDTNGVIWSESFGTADQSTRRSATTNTLYCICSISKMFATTAAMILVEQGLVSLDTPVATYIANFSMPLDLRYRDITVKMLLNHLSGLPGFESRGGTTSAPFSGYAAQMMAGLNYQRLKHDPGAIAAYNNDGFTMVENLVKAVTGEDYPNFVRRNILTPLGMDLSRYQTEPLPANSFARAYSGDTPLPLLNVNVYGTGGLYSTPEELSHLAIMLMNNGVYGSRQILQATSIAAMGQDQTLASFNPVPNESYRYGLGWDTIAQPGLAAIGIKAWQKTGDLNGYYGANILVMPDEKLGVVVFGASNEFASEHAVKISERIMLRALVERGRLDGMPVPLSTTPHPLQSVTPEEKNTYAGFYASSSAVYHLSYGADDSISLDIFGGNWTHKYQNFKLRSDGWYAADGDPVKALQLLTSAGRNYIAVRENLGSGHYSTTSMIGQRLVDKPAIAAVWQPRLSEKWLPVNDNMPIEFPETSNDPGFRFGTITDLTGYLMGKNILCEMTPSSNDRLDGMFLKLPFAGKDMKDAAMETWNGQSWLRMGSYLYRPLSGLPLLASGPSVVSVGSDGFAEWRSLPFSGTLSISGTTGWILYDADFNQLAYGRESGAPVFSGAGTKYLLLYGPMGSTINLNLTTP